MFKISSGKGFQMSFANGWTVSVQFGPANYCENRTMLIDNQFSLSETDRIAGSKGSYDAEIAAWDVNGNWHDFGHDSVKGWCTADEVAQFIHLISTK